MAIWNTLRLGGLLALLGVRTVSAETSFDWTDQANNSFTVTQTLSVTPLSGGTISAQQINMNSLAETYSVNGVQSGVDYSLVSVVVSVQLVSNDGVEWQLSNTSGGPIYGLEVDWAKDYSIPITLGEMTTDPLAVTALTALSITEDDNVNISAGGSYTPPNTQLTSSASTVTISQDSSVGNLDLAAFMTDTDGSTVTLGTTGTLSESIDPGVENYIRATINPNLSLRVTITYNVVPEPTSLALLMTGAAFLLRRRRKLVK